MVHGDGLPDLGGIAAFDLAGFSVGFGFGLKTTMGAVIVRLDLSAYAVIGVGTNPFVLLGRGGLQGELHLGPVSLGVSVDVDLQVGPREDDKWLRTRRHAPTNGVIELFNEPEARAPVISAASGLDRGRHRLGRRRRHGVEVHEDALEAGDGSGHLERRMRRADGKDQVAAARQSGRVRAGGGSGLAGGGGSSAAFRGCHLRGDNSP
jgi:hypothetical protein